MDKINKLANWKVIIFLTLIFMIIFLYVFPKYPLGVHTNEGAETAIQSLDERFSYTHAEVMETFKKMGKTGIENYRIKSGVWDMIFPFIYGLLFFLLIFKLTHVFSNSKWKFLGLIPLIAILFDYIENFGVLKLLDSFESNTITESQVDFNSMATSIKLVFFYLSVLIVIALGAYNLYVKKKSE